MVLRDLSLEMFPIACSEVAIQKELDLQLMYDVIVGRKVLYLPDTTRMFYIYFAPNYERHHNRSADKGIYQCFGKLFKQGPGRESASAEEPTIGTTTSGSHLSVEQKLQLGVLF